MTRAVRRSRSRSGLGSLAVSPPLTSFFFFIIHFCIDFNEDHAQRLTQLEERVKYFDKVAEETVRTRQRMDVMEGSVHRFAGALETFLGRIQIDDRLRLVPDNRRLAESSLPTVSPDAPLVLATIGTGSPSTPLELPMDEDEDDVVVASSSAQDTRTTPSDADMDIRMTDVAYIPPGSALGLVPERSAPPVAAHVPLPMAPVFPAPTVPTSSVPTPTVQLIPATPQGSQDVASPLPTPAPPPPNVAGVDSVPPPLARKRSRTPAVGHLEVEARTTRARSRSKSPM